MSRELLAQAWKTGAGPGDAPLTIDLDSTICETYGLAKEGARHHGYTGARGYHPLLAAAAVTGDVLMARLREGRANTARGAAHFLRETVGRVRYAGARGQLTMRADSGFYTHTVVAVCRRTKVRFSITIRQHQSLRNLIEAVPEADWTPIPYWMEGAAAMAETTYTPFQSEPGAAPVRRPAGEAHARLPTGPLRHLQLSRLHHRPGRGNPGTGGRPPPPRRDRERHPRPQVRRRVESSPLGALRCQRRLARHTGDGPQPCMIRRDATDRPNLGWRKPWASLVVASYPDRARTVAWANCARIMQGRADKEGPTLTQEVPMEGQPRFVGIDVSKAQVDVAVRPTGQRWVVSYDETGVKELVSQMVGLGPAMVPTSLSIGTGSCPVKTGVNPPPLGDLLYLRNAQPHPQ